MWAEWWYYAQVFYAVMGVAIGLSVGFVGVGMLAKFAINTSLPWADKVRFIALLAWGVWSMLLCPVPIRPFTGSALRPTP